MVQEGFQSSVGDAGRLQTQRQYILVGERVRVDEFHSVLVLGAVNGDGHHLPSHERLEHGRLVGVIIRPELLASYYWTHVVPELRRPVKYVAPSHADPSQWHTFGRREICEKSV